MILIDDLIEDSQCQTSVTVKVDGQTLQGYQIAKPLNYEPECTTVAERLAMSKLVLNGKAIAVQYFTDLTDEQQSAYVKNKIAK